jgi:hypothetical protein
MIDFGFHRYLAKVLITSFPELRKVRKSTHSSLAQQHEAKITFAGNELFSLESSVFKNKNIAKPRFIYFPLLVIIDTLW